MTKDFKNTKNDKNDTLMDNENNLDCPSVNYPKF